MVRVVRLSRSRPVRRDRGDSGAGPRRSGELAERDARFQPCCRVASRRRLTNSAARRCLAVTAFRRSAFPCCSLVQDPPRAKANESPGRRLWQERLTRRFSGLRPASCLVPSAVQCRVRAGTAELVSVRRLEQRNFCVAQAKNCVTVIAFRRSASLGESCSKPLRTAKANEAQGVPVARAPNSSLQRTPARQLLGRERCTMSRAGRSR